MPTDHPYLFWAFYEGGGGRALRAGDWKVLQQPYRSAARLYHLAEDLNEAHDLADQQPERVNQLTRMMEEAYQPSPRWQFPSPSGQAPRD